MSISKSTLEQLKQLKILELVQQLKEACPDLVVVPRQMSDAMAYNLHATFTDTLHLEEDIGIPLEESQADRSAWKAAIDQFDRLRKLLRSELGVTPLPATVAKYESLIK